MTEGVGDQERVAGLDPYSAFYRQMILQAREQGASDIHVEPTREGISVRFRVHGEVLPWRNLDIQHRRSFISHVKRLSNLDIAVCGVGQDSRVSLRHWGLDLRVSLGPVQYGEKVTMRLLSLDRKFELSESGLDTATIQMLRDTLKLSHGVILISGPTGSGKTTTLYSLLCALDKQALNIMTIEDPIEYSIDGLVQVPISKRFKFSDALRTALRQDPDVILVGEIRDRETADLCMKAAATGHLVLSTVHANGAAEVVDRLLDLGVERHVLKSVLRFSAAQRLLQKLCPRCALPSTLPSFRIRNLEGCDQCRSQVPGVIGRIPVIEYMGSKSIAAYIGGCDAAAGDRTSLREVALALAQRREVDYEAAIAIE